MKHFTVYHNVPVKLCVYTSDIDLEWGEVYETTYVARTKFRVDSSAARCGLPKEPHGLDEISIQKVINASVNGFDSVNESVERIRLSYLANYSIDSISYYKSDATHNIKEAIEWIIPRANLDNDLKTCGQYL